MLEGGGKAGAEIGSAQSQKSSQGLGECGARPDPREEGPTFYETQRSSKAALGRQRINVGGQTMTAIKGENSRLSRQVGAVSNQRLLPKAGCYMPGWTDHI